MKHVRFDFWENGGWVRLQLADGQVLSWGRSFPTEEGWHSEWTRLRREHDQLKCEYRSDGRDCDGRLSTHQTLIADIRTDLAIDQDVYGNTVRRVRWHEAEASQRDFSAEAMGY